MHVRFGILHKQEILYDRICESHCFRILLFCAEQSQGKKACSAGDNDVLQAGVFVFIFIYTGSAAEKSPLRPHGPYVESQYIWDILRDSASGVFGVHKKSHDTGKIWRQVFCECGWSHGIAVFCDVGRLQGGNTADRPGSDLFHGGIHLDNEEGHCEAAKRNSSGTSGGNDFLRGARTPFVGDDISAGRSGCFRMGQRCPKRGSTEHNIRRYGDADAVFDNVRQQYDSVPHREKPILGRVSQGDKLPRA